MSSGPRNDHTMECQVELHNYFKGSQVDPIMILMDVSSGLHNYKRMSSGLHNYTKECQVDLRNDINGCQVDSIIILMDVSSGPRNDINGCQVDSIIIKGVKWTP